MKEKFKRLAPEAHPPLAEADTLRKRPNEACEALKKLFPEGLKMKWMTDKWEISGMMALDSKGGTSEVKLEIKK